LIQYRPCCFHNHRDQCAGRAENSEKRRENENNNLKGKLLRKKSQEKGKEIKNSKSKNCWKTISVRVLVVFATRLIYDTAIIVSLGVG
jgi:hypothetical protein